MPHDWNHPDQLHRSSGYKWLSVAAQSRCVTVPRCTRWRLFPIQPVGGCKGCRNCKHEAPNLSSSCSKPRIMSGIYCRTRSSPCCVRQQVSWIGYWIVTFQPTIGDRECGFRVEDLSPRVGLPRYQLTALPAGWTSRPTWRLDQRQAIRAGVGEPCAHGDAALTQRRRVDAPATATWPGAARGDRPAQVPAPGFAVGTNGATAAAASHCADFFLIRRRQRCLRRPPARSARLPRWPGGGFRKRMISMRPSKCSTTAAAFDPVAGGDVFDAVHLLDRRVVDVAAETPSAPAAPSFSTTISGSGHELTASYLDLRP